MIDNLFKHLKTIRTHKKWVRIACFKMGIPIQGILHDLSKFSLRELAIAKYYTGEKSPHDTCREILGYSPSWIYHFHRNKHHWEFWCETNVDGVWVPIKIPYKYVIEMFCDFIGAGKAYSGTFWTTSSPLDYWEAKCEGKRLMHPDSLALLKFLLVALANSKTEQDFYDYYNSNKQSIKSSYTRS